MHRKLATVLAMTSLSVASLLVGMLIGPVRAPARPTGTMPPEPVEAVPEVLRAHRFELVDDDGVRRASLHLSDTNEPLFFLYDRAGQTRLSLSVIEDQPGIDLGDAQGNSRVSLWVDGDTAEFQLADKKLRPHLNLACDSTDGAVMVVRDGLGRISATVPPKEAPKAAR